ncbi:MAG: hypothetical protein FWG05_01440 [Kiritimatiellaeota bacterium]|nr:hypothetical protein [Kiritimatiellota bacterium]
MVKETCGDKIGKPNVIELCEDGVRNLYPSGQSTVFYSEIRELEIVEHEGWVYAFSGKNPILTFPRDRIPAETIDAFIDELKRRIHKSASQGIRE